MTTAARPTWAPAKGGEEQGGSRMFGPSQKFSARDMASHTTLKSRKDGQGTKEEIRRRDLKAELEDKEQRHFSSKREKQGTVALPSSAADGPPQKRLIEERLIPRAVDADDSDGEEAKNEDDDEEESDDEDDTAALLAELERIKKERAEEKARKEREQAEAEKKARDAEIAVSNPLLSGAASFNVKRRWDDDVVFRNQARGEVKAPKRFINDTIRSDFHRRFLNKYMK